MDKSDHFPRAIPVEPQINDENCVLLVDSNLGSLVPGARTNRLGIHKASYLAKILLIP